MPPCTSCGAELTSKWNFCIYCGAALIMSTAVPGAIRSDEGAASAPRTRLDVPLLVGIVLGVAGAALLVYMGILFFAPR